MSVLTSSQRLDLTAGAVKSQCHSRVFLSFCPATKSGLSSHILFSLFGSGDSQYEVTVTGTRCRRMRLLTILQL